MKHSRGHSVVGWAGGRETAPRRKDDEKATNFQSEISFLYSKFGLFDCLIWLLVCLISCFINICHFIQRIMSKCCHSVSWKTIKDLLSLRVCSEASHQCLCIPPLVHYPSLWVPSLPSSLSISLAHSRPFSPSLFGHRFRAWSDLHVMGE